MTQKTHYRIKKYTVFHNTFFHDGRIAHVSSKPEKQLESVLSSPNDLVVARRMYSDRDGPLFRIRRASELAFEPLPILSPPLPLPSMPRCLRCRDATIEGDEDDGHQCGSGENQGVSLLRVGIAFPCSVPHSQHIFGYIWPLVRSLTQIRTFVWSTIFQDLGCH